MQEWAQHLFDGTQNGFLILPAAFLMGLTGAVTSCCTLPIAGAVAGYSGSRPAADRGTVLMTGLFFMIGTVLALAALGAAAGFISQITGSILGKYWRVFAGLAAILFGVLSLDLFPWRMPRLGHRVAPSMPTTYLGALLFGLLIGGGTTACSVCCNPALATALGVAVLQGKTLWGAGILTAFAIGYSLPLTTLLMGVSLGKATLLKSEALGKTVRYVSGVLLIGIGFYLLTSLQ